MCSRDSRLRSAGVLGCSRRPASLYPSWLSGLAFPVTRPSWDAKTNSSGAAKPWDICPPKGAKGAIAIAPLKVRHAVLSQGRCHVDGSFPTWRPAAVCKVGKPLKQAFRPGPNLNLAGVFRGASSKLPRSPVPLSGFLRHLVLTRSPRPWKREDASVKPLHRGSREQPSWLSQPPSPVSSGGRCCLNSRWPLPPATMSNPGASALANFGPGGACMALA